jgi:hypothetical protein
VKRDHTIFHAQVGPVRFHIKRNMTPYSKLVFLHLMGSAGRIVHSDATGE